ncbi:MAG: CpsB/CapC family capsule biosynthesis tyrosine phosphatase [Fulvivirga sp.]|uniref:tyrosine-protein phosphatase n=1 Tax=Fulvivirga sp. TaxID=1931237 RepID=UPI0032ECA065
MFNIFKKKEVAIPELGVDLHSHLLPGVDDGVQSFDESLDLLKRFEAIGYKKVITSPHIMSDFYDNKESDLKRIHESLKEKIKENQINISLELAAEYYLDDQLIERLSNKEEEFLTFGNNYLLFETSFMNEPLYLKEFIFKAKSIGINPVLAHPERYSYLQNNSVLLEDLINRQVLFQININSLSGYYSKPIKIFAQKLIDAKVVHFIGSDCHNHKHFEVLESSRKTKYFRKALELPLLNYEL